MNQKALTLLGYLIKTNMNIQAAKLYGVKKILTLKKESIIEKIDKVLDNEMIVGYKEEIEKESKNW